MALALSRLSQLNVILASASPRRMELLRQVGITAQAHPSAVDETRHRGERVQDYVERMALSKAILCQCNEGDLIIAADTVVVLGKQVMGKPASKKNARQMLRRLSGKKHKVLTAVAVRRPQDGHHLTRSVTTWVRFKPLTRREINDYIATGEPMDKAGSYGIQGLGAFMVANLNGSYSSVVGLPLQETLAMMAKLGPKYSPSHASASTG